MPPGAVVGTSSLRREAQLHARYPYLAVTPLRGNLDTRLRKLDEGQFDAIILAAAGLKRLGLGARIRAVLPAEDSLPAAGQGALGIEALPRGPTWRPGSLRLMIPPPPPACAPNGPFRARWPAVAKCRSAPMPKCARPASSARLRRFADGTRMAHAELSGSAADPEDLGLQLAAELRRQGAAEILAALGS
jgi:hydroxymethylbilane synthase